MALFENRLPISFHHFFHFFALKVASFLSDPRSPGGSRGADLGAAERLGAGLR